MKRKMKKYLIGLLVSAVVFAFWITAMNFRSAYEYFQKPKHPTDVEIINDFTKLIDLDDFAFLINHKCNGTGPLLLILISSHPSHLHHRKIIRETWGSIAGPEFKLLFIFGSPVNETDQKLILVENAQNSDIIQGNFLDVYRNLTYKLVMGLKYVKYFCSGAKFILKTDDDVFLNTPRLLKFVKKKLYAKREENLIFCDIIPVSEVHRTSDSKWKVSFSEYPAPFYPPYCSGWYMLFSHHVALKLYEKSQIQNYFYLEDIFLTIFVAPRAGVKIEQFDETEITPRKNLENVLRFYDKSESFVFMRRELKPEEIAVLWKVVMYYENLKIR